jgi:hypothetical protein
MANIPNISLYIQQCIKEDDLPKVFVNSDYSILVPQRHISVQKGSAKPKTIPLEIQEHTSVAFSKMIKTTKRVSPISSVSSHSNTSSTPSSIASSLMSLSSSHVSQIQAPRPTMECHPPNIDH